LRRSLLAVAALAVCVSAWPAGAASARVVTRHYQLATSAATDNSVVRCCGLGVDNHMYGMVWTAAHRGERHVTLTINDDTIGSVAAVIEQTTKNGSKELGTICDGTTKPLSLGRNATGVLVRPAYGACGGGPSAPTTGSVTFHYSR
jgi:hypothetical protein